MNEELCSFMHEAVVRSESLSHKLVIRPADVSGPLHVRDIGMKSARDSAIAELALTQGLTIVSKVADFLALRFVLGEQVRTMWVRLGNGSTDQVEQALRQRRASIEALPMILRR